MHASTLGSAMHVRTVQHPRRPCPGGLCGVFMVQITSLPNGHIKAHKTGTPPMSENTCTLQTRGGPTQEDVVVSVDLKRFKWNNPFSNRSAK